MTDSNSDLSQSSEDAAAVQSNANIEDLMRELRAYHRDLEKEIC